MILLIDALEHLGLNRRVWTEDDFFDICEDELIFYTEIPKKFSFWASIDGESHIGVSKHLKGSKKLFVQLHELGHHFYSAGEEIDQIHFYNANRSKDEFQAHAFAVLAMCPATVLEGKEEFEEADSFARWVRKERDRLRFLYRV